MALGAGKLAIVRQLFTESFTLAALGAGLGWIIALGAASALRSMKLPLPIDAGLDPTFDWRVAIYCLPSRRQRSSCSAYFRPGRWFK